MSSHDDTSRHEQALLEVIAHLEGELHELRDRVLGMDVESWKREQEALRLAPPPASSAAVPVQIMSTTPEPSPPAHVPPVTSTLAENSMVQFLVSHAPWEYQQMLLNGLHKVPANRKTLIAIVIVIAGALYSTGYLQLPSGLRERLVQQYREFSCPPVSVTVHPLPTTPTPTHGDSNGSQTQTTPGSGTGQGSGTN